MPPTGSKPLSQRDFRIEPDLVPAVQTECTGIGLILFHIREDTFHRNRSQRIERGIERLNPRTRRPGTGYPGFDGSDRSSENFTSNSPFTAFGAVRTLRLPVSRSSATPFSVGSFTQPHNAAATRITVIFHLTFFYTIIIQHSFGFSKIDFFHQNTNASYPNT